ncbi:MAG: trypsin-like peptidase domain-containing protein, partial [Verrucomicrobiota bacterium]
PDEFFEQMPRSPRGPAGGLGSGVIISQDGYILTNNHVIDGASEIDVTVPGQKRAYRAKLIGADQQSDVALIKIEAQGLQAVVIADSANLQVGDVVLAVGSPFGLSQTVTQGIVSALGRNKTSEVSLGGGFFDFIQTDASINKGNSGGALVDAQGRLVGINTAIRTSGGYGSGSVGIGFAIPANMAIDIVQKLLDGGGIVKRGFLGVGLKDVEQKDAEALGRDNLDGVLVSRVQANTPADKAGLREGDLILSFNGQPVSGWERLRLDISNYSPGSKVEFQVVRDRKSRTIKVTLGDRDKLLAQNNADLPARRTQNVEIIRGVSVSELNSKVREAMKLGADIQGVLVSSVDVDSPAANAGLTAGSVITMLDQSPIDSVEDAQALVSDFSGETLLVQIFKDGRREILAIEMK